MESDKVDEALFHAARSARMTAMAGMSAGAQANVFQLAGAIHRMLACSTGSGVPCTSREKPATLCARRCPVSRLC